MNTYQDMDIPNTSPEIARPHSPRYVSDALTWCMFTKICFFYNNRLAFTPPLYDNFYLVKYFGSVTLRNVVLTSNIVLFCSRAFHFARVIFFLFPLLLTLKTISISACFPASMLEWTSIRALTLSTTDSALPNPFTERSLHNYQLSCNSQQNLWRNFYGSTPNYFAALTKLSRY